MVSMDDPHNYNGGKGNLVWSMKYSKSAEKMKHLRKEKGNGRSVMMSRSRSRLMARYAEEV